MEDLTIFMMKALQITLMNLVLSGDNIGVIALATRNLPQKHAKSASFIGIFAAMFLRIVFTCLLTYILLIQWLPIRLIGGLILIKITFDFIKPESNKEDKSESNEDDKSVRASNKFTRAIFSIIAADITMSLDNVLAIASLADGSTILIIFGLVLNIPIIFFGSQLVAKLMNKYPIVTYIGAAILAHTSFKLIFEDNLTINLLTPVAVHAISYGAAVLTIIYGLYITNKSAYSLKDCKDQETS
jgi:YjbE family integral membrane protein